MVYFHAVFFQILKLAYGYRSENILREEEKYRFLKEAVFRQKLEPDDEAELLSGIASEISRVKNETAGAFGPIRPRPAIPKVFLRFSTSTTTGCGAAERSTLMICWVTAMSF